MAVLEILEYPDERLKTKAQPVGEVDDSIIKLLDDMAETMYAAPGVGLAANQVGVLKRVAVLDVDYSDGPPNLIQVVDPEIVEAKGKIVWEEGCLSLPGVNEDVERYESILVRALGRDGKTFEIQADGLLAVALQHEIDHLDGIVLLDRVSFLKRRMLHRQLCRKNSSN